MRAWPRVTGPALAVVLGLAIAGCSASTTTTPTPTASSAHTASPPATGGSAGHGTSFNVQVNFTGADSAQGSFTAATVGGAPCSDYASTAFDWTIGIGPPNGTPTTVGGILINFLITMPQSMFHGAGTYAGVVQGVSVGSDDFSGTDSTMTLNGDGTGNASFTNLAGAASGQTESGTVTWTCAG